ncbi:MAG: hypothetical protein IKH81_03650 [Clostridia bacterium]|nr:hypothetical protein [Clostridia bacterium]
MKKIISGFLIALLFLGSFASGEEIEAADIVGEWTYMQPGSLKILTIRDDGTYSLDETEPPYEYQAEGAWDCRGENALVLWADPEATEVRYSLIFEDGLLKFDDGSGAFQRDFVYDPSPSDEDGVISVWYGNIIGIEFKLVLKKEGIYDFVSMSPVFAGPLDVKDGSWEDLGDQILLHGFISGHDCKFEKGDGQLTGIAEAQGISFQGDRVEFFTPPAPKENVTLEDFAGTWISKYKENLNIFTDVSAVRLEMIAVINGTSCYVNTLYWGDFSEMLPNRGPSTFEMQFSGGQLHYEEKMGNGKIHAYGDEFSLTFTALEDDWLCMDLVWNEDWTEPDHTVLYLSRQEPDKAQ